MYNFLVLQGYYRTEAKCWSSSSGGGKWLSKVAITLLLPTLISYWGGLPKIDILKVWSFGILANLKMGIRSNFDFSFSFIPLSIVCTYVIPAMYIVTHTIWSLAGRMADQTFSNFCTLLYIHLLLFSSPDDCVQVEAHHLPARRLHLQEGRRRDGDVHRLFWGRPGRHSLMKFIQQFIWF